MGYSQTIAKLRTFKVIDASYCRVSNTILKYSNDTIDLIQLGKEKIMSYTLDPIQYSDGNIYIEILLSP